MKKNRKYLIALASLFFWIIFPMQVALVSAALPTVTENAVCNGTDLKLTGTGTCTTITAGSDTQMNTLISTIVNIFSIVVGIVAVIMIILGGFKYITSNGDSNNISSAKNTIMYAIVGIVIAALAQVIVRFVLKRATNV